MEHESEWNSMDQKPKLGRILKSGIYSTYVARSLLSLLREMACTLSLSRSDANHQLLSWTSRTHAMKPLRLHLDRYKVDCQSLPSTSPLISSS